MNRPAQTVCQFEYCICFFTKHKNLVRRQFFVKSAVFVCPCWRVRTRVHGWLVAKKSGFYPAEKSVLYNRRHFCPVARLWRICALVIPTQGEQQTDLTERG